MSDNNKPWVVDVNTVDEWGVRLNNSDILPLSGIAYRDHATCTYSGQMFWFRFYRGDERSSGSQDGTITVPDSSVGLFMSYWSSVREWARRVYNLSEDVVITDNNVFPESDIDPDLYGSGSLTPHVISYYGQKRFETETKALDYVDSLSPTPIITFNDGDYLFSVSFTQEIAGVSVDRTVGLRHSGDPLAIYTVTDLENYYASAMGVDEAFVLGTTGRDAGIHLGLNDGINYQETSLDITVINLDDHGSSTITIEPDFEGIPGSSSITIVDGDPPLTLTEIVNGDGSITISNDGRIDMSNDGGSFYLNEFGHSGMYANGDVSLTAGQTAQLGVGSHSISVVSDGFIFQEGGEMLKVSLARMKEVFGE